MSAKQVVSLGIVIQLIVAPIIVAIVLYIISAAVEGKVLEPINKLAELQMAQNKEFLDYKINTAKELSEFHKLIAINASTSNERTRRILHTLEDHEEEIKLCRSERRSKE